MQGVNVGEVLFDENDFARGVQISIEDQLIDLPTKFVVDASGRGTLLGGQTRPTTDRSDLQAVPVHAWFDNVSRGTGESADYIHIYFLPVTRGWVWQIPINETVSSVGVVAEREVFKQSKQRVEEYFFDHIAMSPDLAAAMSTAKQVNEFKSEADYSYMMSRFVGNGWMLVGDAARFVDPIFSSGVSIACESAKFASETIIAALEADDVSEANFLSYEKKIKKGVTVWYEFIRLYYKLMHLFTYFIDSKEHRLQILQLLQGEVYEHDDVPVLEAMRNMIRTVEETPGHIWKPHLTDIPID